MTSSSPARRSGWTAAVAAATALAVLGAAAAALQVARERRGAPQKAREEVLYVTAPAVVQRLALSFDAVVADLYWIRAIQYFGSTRLSADPDKDYALLYPLLDLTTSLDPKFSIAYRFGAFFLSEEKPGGADRPDLAVRLLEKAIAANPGKWEYLHDLAFLYYREGDYRTAANWFLKAAALPGSAPWLKPLAAVVLAGTGDTATSRVLWRNMLDSEDEFMRREAERRLLQIEAIDTIAILERLIAEYSRRLGRPPSTWQDMMRAGLLRGTPADPAGTPYVLNPSTGRVTLATDSPLWPLPTDAPA